MRDNRKVQYAVEIPQVLKESNYGLMEKFLIYDKELANTRYQRYKKDLARYPLREAIAIDDEKMVDLLLKYDVNIHVQDSIIVYDLIDPDYLKYYNKLKNKIDIDKLEPSKTLDSLLKKYELNDIINNNIPGEFLELKKIYSQEILVKTLVNKDLETFNELTTTISPSLSYDNGRILKLMVYYNLLTEVKDKNLSTRYSSELIQLAIRGKNNELAKNLLIENNKQTNPKYLRQALTCSNTDISSYMISYGANLEDTHWGYNGQQTIEVFGL